jgi:hypothetical protein
VDYGDGDCLRVELPHDPPSRPVPGTSEYKFYSPLTFEPFTAEAGYTYRIFAEMCGNCLLYVAVNGVIRYRLAPQTGGYVFRFATFDEGDSVMLYAVDQTPSYSVYGDLDYGAHQFHVWQMPSACVGRFCEQNPEVCADYEPAGEDEEFE